MLKNAKQLPKVYYGLHMVEGVAEYQEPNTQPYRIFIGEEAIKNMDPSFQGKPVYVRHVDEVALDKLQTEADGYVSESFYNQLDGKHWVKFIVVSDKGHNAIQNGWKLSNAYIPKQMGGGGLWHGVEFIKEVKQGEYEHLAIVPNPRYEESVILTPEQYKEYCGEKETELKRLANSKEGETTMLQLFKKTKVENSIDIANTSVVLPKSKKEMTLEQVVNGMDDYELKMKEPQMANDEHHVEMNGEKMSVGMLKQKYNDAIEKLKGYNEAGEPPMGEEEAAEKKKNDEEAKMKKENEEKEAKEKKENEDKEKAEEKKKNAANFEALKNAPANSMQPEQTVDLSSDKVARGKVRYGS